jgi:Tfp pilus assembly protein PilW
MNLSGARRVGSKGVTLLELMAAALIMAFVLTGLLRLFINCIILNESSRNLTMAMSHAQYVMEDISAAGIAGLATRINNGGTVGWDFNAAQFQAAYGLTPLNNEAIATAVTQAGDPLGVSVTVTWFDRSQRARIFTLQTLITSF